MSFGEFHIPGHQLLESLRSFRLNGRELLLEKSRIMELATLHFIDERENLVLLGPPGVGKTMLSVALAIKACQAGFSVYFTTLDDMVRQLQEAHESRRDENSEHF